MTDPLTKPMRFHIHDWSQPIEAADWVAGNDLPAGEYWEFMGEALPPGQIVTVDTSDWPKNTIGVSWDEAGNASPILAPSVDPEDTA